MRQIVAAIPLLALAACGEGSGFDTAFRESYRAKGVESCVSSARSAAGSGGGGADFQRLCECMIDRLMEGKSARELMSAPDAAEEERVAEQCIAEVRGGKRRADDRAGVTPPDAPNLLYYPDRFASFGRLDDERHPAAALAPASGRDQPQPCQA